MGIGQSLTRMTGQTAPIAIGYTSGAVTVLVRNISSVTLTLGNISIFIYLSQPQLRPKGGHLDYQLSSVANYEPQNNPLQQM
jgi:hypothetical protein